MRTSASQRRTTLARFVLALLLGVTQMGTALHFALVRHVMASDGALVHGTDKGTEAAPNTVSADATVTQLPSAGCSFAVLQRTPFAASAPIATVSPVRSTSETPAVQYACVRDSSGTYRLAPKSSPPA